MSTATVQQPFAPTSFDAIQGVKLQPEITISEKESYVKPHDVATALYYYKAPEDGSPPPPTYVDRPETYDRPCESHDVTVHDVNGHEKEYTLDGNGFQVHSHSATEKDFLSAVEKVIRGGLKFNSTAAYAQYN